MSETTSDNRVSYLYFYYFLDGIIYIFFKTFILDDKMIYLNFFAIKNQNKTPKVMYLFDKASILNIIMIN